jgi:hypothetical protein
MVDVQRIPDGQLEPWRDVLLEMVFLKQWELYRPHFSLRKMRKARRSAAGSPIFLIGCDAKGVLMPINLGDLLRIIRSFLPLQIGRPVRWRIPLHSPDVLIRMHIFLFLTIFSLTLRSP